jgi:hypothetical protein
MRLDTAKNIINDAAIEAGIIASAIDEVYASTLPLIVQMRALLKSIGQDLVDEREQGWTHLQAEHTFDTVDGTASYALPAGFHCMIPQTGWNRDTGFPLSGPSSPQDWQLSKSGLGANRLYVAFRPLQQKIFLDPTPEAVETIAFEYRTYNWVAAAGETTPTKSAPTTDDDVVLFDRLLMVKALKYAILSEKGLATLGHLDDYESAAKKAIEADGAASAKVLNLGGSRCLRLLGSSNIPDGGFGS